LTERTVAGLTVREWGDPADPGILLWPGLGANSGYFAAVAPALPGRAVAVDPPGFGRSAPLQPYTYERLVELAAAVAQACGCWSIVGHSLGAYVAAGVAAAPPAGLRAAVLLDGAFMDAATMAESGMPVTLPREQFIAWMRTNELHYPDWETAVRGLAMMLGGAPTPAFEAYVRGVYVEADGGIRHPTSPEEMADQVRAVVGEDVLARAGRVQVPTLLIASGQPAESWPGRERAWRQFADASSLIELHVADSWGHNAILQDAEASTRLIADWLERHR
jgi:pimeloyl-ACP methyl ester carboxylesterase